MATTLRRPSLPPPAIQFAVPFRLFLLIALLSLLTSMSAASTIVGKVVNLSRNRPSSGDDVVLYRVDQTMHEVARTKSDAHGAFRFEGWGGSHYLVAASHQKVSYHTKLLSGTDPVEVSVYDAAPKLTGAQETSDTIFPKADNDLLRVTEFFVVLNQSNPPRTLSARQTFNFLLPRGAVLDSTAVQPPGTLPFLVSTSAYGSRDQYCIAYPIRPGTTKIRALYHLQYTGKISITPPLLRTVKEVALMVPESLNFEAKFPGIFLDRGKQNGLSVYLATNVRPGESLTFSLSGANRIMREETAATTVAPSGLSLAKFAGLARPVQQLALYSPGKRFLSWAILIGALLTAVFLVALACRRAIRVPVQQS